MDLLLRQAWLIDGSGDPGRAAEVAVTGDRISAVGRPGELTPGHMWVNGVATPSTGEDIAGVAAGQVLRS